MKRARYFRPGKSWIIVEILETLNKYYRVRPIEWSGVSREIFVVSAKDIEPILQDRF